MLVVGAIGFTVDAALAKEITLAQGKSIMNSCAAGGGTSWTPGSTGHTSGCMNKDGSGVVCGGFTKQQQKTCSTFRVQSRDVGAIGARLGSASTADRI